MVRNHPDDNLIVMMTQLLWISVSSINSKNVQGQKSYKESAALISKSTLSTISYAHFQVDAAVLIFFTASYQCNGFSSCFVLICLEFLDCTGLSCLHLRQMLRGQTEKLLMNVLSHVLFGPGAQWGAHCAEIDWMMAVCLVAFVHLEP